MTELYDYQAFGAGWLAGKNAGILADEPGLGKTAQSIRACDEVKAQDILVVCPATAKLNWKREFERWQQYDRNVSVTYGYDGSVHPHGVAIVNYDLLSNAQSQPLRQLLKRDFDVVILDEGHALKNKSNRTKALYGKRIDGSGGIVKGAKRVWILSGTPMPNHAGELWTHFNALAPYMIDHRDKMSFENQYCKVRDTIYGRQITGSKNIEELREKIQDFVLRRKAKDVLPDLPDLTLDWVPLDKNMLPSQSLAVLTGGDPLEDLREDSGWSDDEFIAALRRQSTHMATERRNTGVVKVPACMDWLETEMATTKSKFIVFGVHHDVIDAVMERAAAWGSFHAVKLDGRDNDLQRNISIDQFQNDPNTRLFVGQIQAAGEAITLTAANRVVFFEPDWTPKNVYQAIRRALRIGQKNHVLAQFLTLEGTIDERINKAVMRKAADIHQMFG